MTYKVPHHIWRTADGRLVPDLDPDAAILAFPAGTELTDHDAEAKGVRGVYAEETKSVAKPEDKSVGKPGDKAVSKPDDKAPEPGPSAEPKKSASKAEWVEYAVSKGGDRADAETATRDDLAVVWGSSGK